MARLNQKFLPITQAYLKFCQTSNMELFVKLVKGFRQFDVIKENSCFHVMDQNALHQSDCKNFQTPNSILVVLQASEPLRFQVLIMNLREI